MVVRLFSVQYKPEKNKKNGENSSTMRVENNVCDAFRFVCIIFIVTRKTKKCFVPKCTNSSESGPNELFLLLPVAALGVC